MLSHLSFLIGNLYCCWIDFWQDVLGQYICASLSILLLKMINFENSMIQRRQKLLLFSVPGEKHSCIGFSFRILVFDLIIMLLRSLTFNLPLFFSPFVISPSKLIQGTYGYLDGVHRLKGNQLWNDELLKARLLSSPHLLSPVFQACPICYYRLLKREQK